MDFHENNRRGTKRGFPDEEPSNASGLHGHDRGFHHGNRPSYDDTSIPHGWIDCPPLGQPIDLLIPSKVPLGESYNHLIPGQTYSPQEVIHQLKISEKELGLVIDLTNTNRYYPASYWRNEDIDYVKIRCRGKDEEPDDESVDKFVYEASRFCSQKTDSPKYVLVHCTHGHNRTGFMIVHFLVRTKSMSVTEAINKFAMARPPGIYKAEYIDALYLFYHESKPETVVCPQTPEWKRSDIDVNSEVDPNRILNGTSWEGSFKTKAMTIDDVLGDTIHFDQLQALRQVCYELLKLHPGGRGKLQFPGSHPVSLNRENLQFLRQRYYYATWKADGTRYMMLITYDGCYLIDRKFEFRRVSMRFPCRSTNGDIAERTHHNTLIDGEMIIDTDQRTGKQERRYLIYDLMAVNEMPLVELPFHKRWEILNKEVIEPRNWERKTLSKRIYDYEGEPFSVRSKGFYMLSAVPKLLKKFIPELSHEADGLIFQGWDDPYVPRTHEGLLKWKFPEMNSVDFLYELESDSRRLLYLNERGRRKLMGGNRVVFKNASDPSAYSGMIIECSWDAEENVWVCMRARPDKSTPNEFVTYKKVLRSIKDNITEEVVLNDINEIVCLPMYADRIQREIRAHQQALSARRR